MADKPPVAMETRGEGGDGRRYSPSSARNRQPILDVLRELLPADANVLEIASGTGEHGAFFLEALAELQWTYSDIDPVGLDSQRAWRSALNSPRLNGPLHLDASSLHWGDAERTVHWSAIYSANMVHIAPFNVAEGLFLGAGRLLQPGGQLVLYGPFARAGEIAPSNAAFSENLQGRDARWGVRDLEWDLLPLAEAAQLRLDKVVEMPANNLMVFFIKN